MQRPPAVLGSLFASRDARGSVTGWILLAADIGARRREGELEAELLIREQAARVAVEAANRMKDEFLATVSHELRTPLNAILGWVHMLRAGMLDAGKTARAIETIERNAHVQTQIVDDILEVSRSITGTSCAACLRMSSSCSSMAFGSTLTTSFSTLRPLVFVRVISGCTSHSSV